MNNRINRIISASAGTGKTYRLSLEYLALLLRFTHNPDFKPDQILVITFTKKATAEIRERIYQQLDILGNRKAGWEQLAVNLKKLTENSDGGFAASAEIINSDVSEINPLSEQETEQLKNIYNHLISHKDELQVMTIDSYIQSVFRNLVCPARGINRFELDLKAVEKRLPFLFNELMTPRLLSRVESLLSRRVKPALDEFKIFFRSLIDNRWLYYLITKRTIDTGQDSFIYRFNHPEQWNDSADEAYQKLSQTWGLLISNFSDYLQGTHNMVQSAETINAGFLNKDFVSIFHPFPVAFFSLVTDSGYVFKDDRLALKLLKLLSQDKFIWNGQKVRASKALTEIDNWKALHKQTLTYLSDYLLYHHFMPEMAEIIDIWSEVLAHYDKLIYKYKDFTYDDIAWFTFEGLYSSEPPLFEAEKESIANEFYEFMCHRTRFMLIDEFQDTSIIQFQILAPMIEELIAGYGSKPYGGLIVVGDEKQSIFGWRGGQRDLLLNLDSIFTNLQSYAKDSLTDSWRSSPRLINFINNVFSNENLHTLLKNIHSEWNYPVITGRKTELDEETIIRLKLQNCSKTQGYNAALAMRDFVSEMIIPAVLANNKQEKNGSIAILARRNKELEMIRILLAEQGITSEYQSSNSLLDHQYIKPILYLLRFLAYGDWYDFLAFLRSDLVLLDGASVKQVIRILSTFQQDKSASRSAIDFTDVPAARAAWELIQTLDSNNIYKSCLQIIQTCAIKDKLDLERDFVNIQRFLDIVFKYENNYQTELKGIQGFLRFCEDNRNDEVFSQKDVINSSAVQLLTIHKSKGLEFDSVFVWWNLKGTHGREDNTLSSWVHYSDKNYHNLKDIALSLHYNKVLETGSYCGIIKANDYTEQLEELNNLYVAVTRAKSRLYLYTIFEHKDGWEAYIDSRIKDDKLTPQHCAVIAAKEYMLTQAELLEDGSYQIGNPVSAEHIVTSRPYVSSVKEYPDLKSILPDWQKTPEYLPNDNQYDMNMKASYLVNRDNLIGDIAHYYLSQLTHAGSEEIERAAILTKRQFGNLMSTSAIDGLITNLQNFLPTIIELFDPDYDLIFNEYTIFDRGKEHRIDRLMINTKNKTYRIIDYKTGKTHNPYQLDIYASILKNSILPKDFKQDKEPVFVEIKL